MSSLLKAVEEYVRLRRSLGFRLHEEGSGLADFVAFLDEQHAPFITADLAVRWATRPQNVLPARWTRRLTMVRRFAQHLSASDPRNQVPARALLPYRYHRRPPHIYTDEEVLRLIEAARQIPPSIRSMKGLRAWTYSTLFGLLAVTGMRVGEALRLDRADVDWSEGVLTIRGTKFHKSRLVALHPSAQRALQQYAHFRDRLQPHAKTDAFFVSERGPRLGYYRVLDMFIRLSREIGLRGASSRDGPRLHDLRHRFAVTTLLNWYRRGVDVDQHMPELAAYLGHGLVTDTYWYLSATPELLQLAAMRLDNRQGGSLS